MPAPQYIEADTYAGKWQLTKASADRIGWETAERLAEQIGHGNTSMIWEYSGKTRAGHHLFTRTRFVAWNGELHGYTAEGSKIIIHPVGRVVRYLGRVTR